MQVLETLKKHQLLDNLKKCEFSQQSLVYLGYVIGGGELKIDHKYGGHHQVASSY
jgi:hypothetical protein